MTELGEGQFQTLHDHYKDSFFWIRDREKIRDRLFPIVLVVIGVLFLFQHYPDEVLAIASSVSGQTGIADTGLPIAVLRSLGWALTFILMHRFLQTSLTIDRQYVYLHGLEKILASQIGQQNAFRREGNAYNGKYPLFSWWSWTFYVFLVPAAVWVLCVTLIWSEVGIILEGTRTAIFDGVIFILLSFSIGTKLWYSIASELRKAEEEGDDPDGE